MNTKTQKWLVTLAFIFAVAAILIAIFQERRISALARTIENSMEPLKVDTAITPPLLNAPQVSEQKQVDEPETKEMLTIRVKREKPGSGNDTNKC